MSGREGAKTRSPIVIWEGMEVYAAGMWDEGGCVLPGEIWRLAFVLDEAVMSHDGRQKSAADIVGRSTRLKAQTYKACCELAISSTERAQ
jgi:hypothetical protein